MIGSANSPVRMGPAHHCEAQRCEVRGRMGRQHCMKTAMRGGQCGSKETLCGSSNSVRAVLGSPWATFGAWPSAGSTLSSRAPAGCTHKKSQVPRSHRCDVLKAFTCSRGSPEMAAICSCGACAASLFLAMRSFQGDLHAKSGSERLRAGCEHQQCTIPVGHEHRSGLLHGVYSAETSGCGWNWRWRSGRVERCAAVKQTGFRAGVL